MAWKSTEWQEKPENQVHHPKKAALQEGQKFKPVEGKLTIEQWGANEDTADHVLAGAAAGAKLGKDDSITEEQFKAAVAAFHGIKLSHHAHGDHALRHAAATPPAPKAEAPASEAIPLPPPEDHPAP